MRSPDTTREAEAIRIALLRAKSAEERVADMAELSDAVRRITRDGLRSQNPHLNEQQLDRALFRAIYGSPLAALVWPEFSDESRDCT